MNLKDIEKLIKLVEDSGLSKLSVEEDGVKIELIKEAQDAVVYQSAPVIQHVAVPQASSQVAPVAVAQVTGEPVKEVGVEIFLSPMVGTFYATPSPEAPDFVKVGDKVKKGQSLCIIEAMKLFNEIEADYNGTILEILVNNQDAVEFGQPLFKIKKDA
ncbi:MAG: acetyl-CoA carboxylase biotin carboxyl carrier protein [Candidatus Margulisbacteria bacterium]|nr:acetyl-CoA carboxylase biotin carboxyl carrier protein [Candidatus Margulisiibacteriota bacterium]